MSAIARSEDIIIRKATESDTAELEKLFLITRQQTFYWEPSEKFQLSDFAAKTAGEIVFVAERKNQIVGFISVWKDESPPFIHNLFVAKDSQREGVGELLINSLLSWLPPPYRLKCLLRNHTALSFYRKNRWIEIEHDVSEEGPYYLFELDKNDEGVCNYTIER